MTNSPMELRAEIEQLKGSIDQIKLVLLEQDKIIKSNTLLERVIELRADIEVLKQRMDKIWGYIF